ncbi:cell filamentation protein [Bartonella silvatica]|uniref:protein adenylyltransferase n=1 Tax=Bartonella silvatica TaxID=357760 RepID=A0ABV2HGA5_9HYPH
MLEQNYLYKNTNTLKNKYHIKDPQRLYQRCALDTAKAAAHFRHEPLPNKFDAAYLKQIHWSLFHNSFEWAGKTRDQIFTFEDGSKAYMPAMRPKGYETPFAIGPQIRKELHKLEKTLSTKNNLTGLSRKDFAQEAAEIFMALDRIHPFRTGNGRTQRMFMEKLGQAAGYQIDFSAITKERMLQASIQAMQHGNKEPMQHLFEDMTHPQKSLILKEFILQMRQARFSEINNRLVIAAKEGETYEGIYRGHAAEGFVIEVEAGFVVAHKDDLSPEQIKTLQNGIRICFTKENIENLKKTLIPSEKLAPLTDEELSERATNNPVVQARRTNVENLSKVVYGNRYALNARIDMITQDPNLSEVFAQHVTQNPQSIHKLAGKDMFCLKTSARIHAQEHVADLGEALKCYAAAVGQAKCDILEQQNREQKRLEQSVDAPEKDLQNLFNQSSDQQRETLSHSRELQQKLHHFSRKLSTRLSSEDRRAIQENDHTRLACLLGVSESKAQEISQTMQHMKEAQYQARNLKVSRSSSMALTG